MANRFRNRDTGRTRGKVTYVSDGSVYYDDGLYSQREDVSDVTGYGDNWDFTKNSTIWSGGELNTLVPDPTRNFSAYRVTGMVGQFTPNSSYPGQKPYGTYASMAAARTNPSAPYVDVPVAIFELGDLTHLLRETGNSLIKKGAGKYLEYQFLWKPLISDLVKLTDFHDAVARRVAIIEKLAGPRGYRRTVDLDALSTSKSILWDPQSVHLNLPSRNEQIIGRRTIRAHVRWKAAPSLSGMPRRDIVALARRAVLGVTIDLSTLWEIMPWSWLIDWGWNIGSYLKANRNIIPASLDNLTIIETTTDRVDFKPMTLGNHTMGAGSWEKTVKKRFRQTVAPVAHFPFLTESQMGIVSALAITRMK